MVKKVPHIMDIHDYPESKHRFRIKADVSPQSLGSCVVFVLLAGAVLWTIIDLIL